MSRLAKLLVVALLGCGSAGASLGFSLLGPNAEWMTEQLGYVDDPPSGGGVNLGEEYRWNVDNISYGFSPSFLNFFGTKGAKEIEDAIAVYEDLPKFSKVNVNDFPLKTLRRNHRAVELGLLDLKSAAMRRMAYQLGLGDPLRFVNELRKRTTENDSTNYLVIRRNFDPETFDYSPIINGVLYTYTTILEIEDPATTLVVNSPADPLAFGHQPVANQLVGVGNFRTGLTRDDVGALKYIYRKNNINLEQLPTGATNASFFSGQNTLDNAGVGQSPWTSPFVNTNQAPGGGQQGQGGQQQQPAFGPTNVVSLGLRQGLDKLNFTRVDFNNLLGLFTPVTAIHEDTVLSTNQVALTTQRIARELDRPDILFHAADLRGGPDDIETFSTMLEFEPTGSLGDDDNFIFVDEAVPPDTDTGSGENPIGPGIIEGPFNLTFSTAGPNFQNFFPNFLSEVNSSEGILWGSFDGSTNAPVVYPDNRFVDEIEQEVAGEF